MSSPGSIPGRHFIHLAELAPAPTSAETNTPMDWLDKIFKFWPHIAAGFDFLAALLASFHAPLNKHDPRAATLWLGLIWFLPLLAIASHSESTASAAGL